MSDKSYKFICRLSNVQRFQGRSLTAKYSVADHSFRVAYIAMRLTDSVALSSYTKFKVLQKALMHDFEEALLGDIPSPYKKYLGSDYTKAAKTAIIEETGLPEHYVDLWETAKDKLVAEGEIVELADKLELFVTAAFEVESGNLRLMDVFNQLDAFFKRHWENISTNYPYAVELITKARQDVTRKI